MYKILVADDEKDIVSLLKDYFEMNDYLVLTAYSGARRWKRQRRTRILSCWMSICRMATDFAYAGKSVIMCHARLCF